MSDPAGDRTTLRGRLLLLALRVLAAVPEALLVAAADAVGELWYRLAPKRADQARANLRRACEGLAATGRGPARAHRAAADEAALERLVRACFRHTARYYVEVLRAGRYDAATSLARIDIETPDVVDEALRSGKAAVLVGLHFGAIELPAMYMANAIGKPVTAPMESVDDPALRRWFQASRSRVGVNLVPVVNARRPLLEAIRRGESVGLVNDRDLTGGGIPVPLFGSPAPIPPGAALLALETGAPIYVAACRRAAEGRYIGRMIRVDTPAEGTKRERMTGATAAIAAAFESVIADAPEQWWGAFHPIWPDLAVGAADRAKDAAGAAA